MKKRSLLFIIISIAIAMILTAALTSCTEEHSHSFETGYTYNSSGHWHAATCGCGEEIITVVEHTYGSGVKVDPSFDYAGYTEYTCTECGYVMQAEPTDKLPHNYSTDWSYNEESHWNDCIDEGYAGLMQNVAPHQLSEEIITDSTSETTGVARYTCAVCEYSYEASIPKKTHIVTLPTVTGGPYYVGQPLSSVTLEGGVGSVEGSFAWADPSEMLKAGGEYTVVFTPADADSARVEDTLTVNADQLTVSVLLGEHGSSDVSGTINVNYGDDLTVYFTPDFGYQLSAITLDGANVGKELNYTIENITKSHSVTANFATTSSPIEINCMLGDKDCYKIEGSTLTFTGITQDSTYTISGEAVGNIVIDIDPAYKLELEFIGFILYSNAEAPIVVLNGDKINLSAKNGYKNFIYDTRPSDSETGVASLYPAAIYSLVDLGVKGKGTLTVVSGNHGGIYTKKDLEVKNLMLNVTCTENALRGNDSVSVTLANLNLIATNGDAIKTTKSDISSKGKQRGDVTIAGGTHYIYAAEDGIQAEHNVVIDDVNTKLNIFTDKYSEHSKITTSRSADTFYLRTDTMDYKYSVKFSGTETAWENATLVGEGLIDGEACYYYAVPLKSGATHMSVYSYLPTQEQGQSESFHASIENIAINEHYDTLALNYKSTHLAYRFTNYAVKIGDETVVMEHSTKGIKAGNSISIANGTVNITSYGDAIRANDDTVLENGQSAMGNVTISGGTITLSSTTAAIHADGTLQISAGTVSITASYTGLSGDYVKVLGGSCKIVSASDKITSKDPANITVTAGTVEGWQ